MPATKTLQQRQKGLQSLLATLEGQAVPVPPPGRWDGPQNGSGAAESRRHTRRREGAPDGAAGSQDSCRQATGGG
jgi:hypothetical protein